MIFLLSSEAIKLFNHSVYKTESEWLSETGSDKATKQADNYFLELIILKL